MDAESSVISRFPGTFVMLPLHEAQASREPRDAWETDPRTGLHICIIIRTYQYVPHKAVAEVSKIGKL